jgi:hypothetical protein
LSGKWQWGLNLLFFFCLVFLFVVVDSRSDSTLALGERLLTVSRDSNECQAILIQLNAHPAHEKSSRKVIF